MADLTYTPEKRVMRRSTPSNVSQFFARTRTDAAFSTRVQPLPDEATHAYAARMSALSLESETPFSAEEFLKTTSASSALTLEDLRAISGGLYKWPKPEELR